MVQAERLRRREDNFELTVRIDAGDACDPPGVQIVLIDSDRPFGHFEPLVANRFANLRRHDAVGFLHCLLPQINRRISRLGGIIGRRVG